MDEKELNLDQFHGTSQYHKHFTGIVYTDGIKYLADNTNCYWLDEEPRISQEMEYTDFPLDEIEVYCINGVILLKSEY